MGKRGQQSVGMSFGMIFAIFLIIVFVVIAGIAIGGFLELGETANIGLFYDELQEAVNNVVRGQSGEISFEINLPNDIEMICFANLSAPITNRGADYEIIKDYGVYEANLFLLPPEYAQNMQWKMINRVNITKTTKTSNPYCVDVNVDLRIRKGFYDRSAWIE